jgi:hypothetical protein
MKKQNALKVINVLLLILILCVVTSAILHDFIPYVVYMAVHALPGMFFVILAIIHIILNWSWVKSNYFKKQL